MTKSFTVVPELLAGKQERETNAAALAVYQADTAWREKVESQARDLVEALEDAFLWERPSGELIDYFLHQIWATWDRAYLDQIERHPPPTTVSRLTSPR